MMWILYFCRTCLRKFHSGLDFDYHQCIFCGFYDTGRAWCEEAKINYLDLDKEEKEEEQEIAHRYNFGRSLEELATEYKKHHNTIREIVLKNGVKLKYRGQRGLGKNHVDNRGKYGKSHTIFKP